MASAGAIAASSLAARASIKLGLALCFALAAVPACARADAAAESSVQLAQLPPQARQTDELIRRGGPFPYGKDGSVFGNRELHLPRQARGYYREYTVPTPGAHDRGARRIVCGGVSAKAPEACYYTADHYASFQRIAP